MRSMSAVLSSGSPSMFVISSNCFAVSSRRFIRLWSTILREVRGMALLAGAPSLAAATCRRAGRPRRDDELAPRRMAGRHAWGEKAEAVWRRAAPANDEGTGQERAGSSNLTRPISLEHATFALTTGGLLGGCGETSGARTSSCRKSMHESTCEG